MRRSPCYLTAEIVQIAGVHEFVHIAISRLAKYFQDYAPPRRFKAPEFP